MSRKSAPSTGVRGEFKLLSFMDDPVSVLEHDPLLDDKGRRRYR
ncbi:MAG: hypothetical protein WDN06_03650 [Asticcacaulis sp.]